ncbi:Hint domain-containing protein, partial [Cribrihabitans sp. XS_ASV171]
ESDTFDGACFLAGTRIATPLGERAIELLAPGDLILTAGGRAVPVRFVGRQRVLTAFGLAKRSLPVRIRAGALGDGLPKRDLVLTGEHALLIDELLINAAALVNGESIDWVPLREFHGSYTVYNVETEDHDVLLAEGVPAETFIDYVDRAAFDNYQEYLDRYGEDRTISEMSFPRISAGRLVPANLKSRFAGTRAA